MLNTGDAFQIRHHFTAEDIAAFARMTGDMNPLHHDADAAAASRFGGLIASGTQSSALLMGLIATSLSKTHDTAGLEFTFRFRRGIPAGLQALLTWRIAAIEPHAKLGGDLVTCAGEITDAAGARYLTAEARAVIWPKNNAHAGANAPVKE
jgi:3-hydroxybutyryl-CoA dehydratase